MSNMNPLITRLVDLYKDNEFKAKFIENYLKYTNNLTTIDNEYSLAFKMINNSTATASSPALSALPNKELKRILLSISSTGLSFDPTKKHFYLLFVVFKSAEATKPAGTVITPNPIINIKNVKIWPPAVIGYTSP